MKNKEGSKRFFFGHAEGVLLARQKKQKTFAHLGAELVTGDAPDG